MLWTWCLLGTMEGVVCRAERLSMGVRLMRGLFWMVSIGVQTYTWMPPNIRGNQHVVSLF